MKSPPYKKGDVVRLSKEMWHPVKQEDPVGIVLEVGSDTCHVLVGDEKRIIHYTRMYKYIRYC